MIEFTKPKHPTVAQQILNYIVNSLKKSCCLYDIKGHSKLLKFQ